MIGKRVIVGGIVKNGVVVPRENIKLLEGTYVEILIPAIPPELQAEFDAWEAISDDDFAAFEKALLEEEGDPNA